MGPALDGCRALRGMGGMGAGHFAKKSRGWVPEVDGCRALREEALRGMGAGRFAKKYPPAGAPEPPSSPRDPQFRPQDPLRSH